jgi:hypothetical protein
LALAELGAIALLGDLLERQPDFWTPFTAVFLKRRGGIPVGDVRLTWVASGHDPFGGNTTPQENGKTRKEGLDFLSKGELAHR